jgi:hypothetical protein
MALRSRGEGVRVKGLEGSIQSFIQPSHTGGEINEEKLSGTLQLQFAGGVRSSGFYGQPRTSKVTSSWLSYPR